MNIHEYQAKELLAKFGVPVPAGHAAMSVDEAVEAAGKLPGPLWVVKAQIHAGGRGKGKFKELGPDAKGGVRLAKSLDEVRAHAAEMLGNTLVTIQTGDAGKQVQRLYITDGVDIAKEFYLALLVDRDTGRIAIVASTEGGMDIETVAHDTPEKIETLTIDPATGLMPHHGRAVAAALGLKGDLAKQASFVLAKLYDAFIGTDASQIEINPLAVTDDGKLLVLDAKVGFDSNAMFRHKGLFGVRPQLQPLESFDPVIAKIDALVPGSGPLLQRIDTFSNRFNIPKDRLKPVFDAAIAECRRRTLEHIKLPANERFDMAFVTGKSWGGYNYYQGNNHSKIEINTDLPIRISRAVDLGCHEGYPGHHVLNALLEERLTKGRKWVEFSVYPLYSPESLLAEGSANYGIKLAFPGKEQVEFEKRVLYPLAGLPANEADRFYELSEAKQALSGANFTIMKQFLEGNIDEPKAIALVEKYQLQTPERARKSIEFAKQYRSYIINYGLGQDMVKAYVEAAGADPKARWARMETILSEPTLPGDLKPNG